MAKTHRQKGQVNNVNETTRTVEVTPMTNEQSTLLILLTRFYELTTMKESTTDSKTLEYLVSREKALRTALESILNA